jgi:hypothetical protein
MEVSVQLHALAILPPGKEFVVLIGWEAGWAPELARIWRQKILALLTVEAQLYSL